MRNINYTWNGWKDPSLTQLEFIQFIKMIIEPWELTKQVKFNYINELMRIIKD